MGKEHSRSIIVLRISGEVCTKADSTRKEFHRTLKKNIKDMLTREQISHSIRDHWYRMDVETNDPRAPRLLSHVFGVQAVHHAYAYRWESLEDIVELGVEFFKEKVQGKTFAVRAKRAGPRESMPFNSMDVERALGGALWPYGKGVDLKNHEVRVGLEVRSGEVFFFAEEYPGPAGLPVGTEGNALALMSGGFDSAVASWLMLQRGVQLDFLFFDLGGLPHQRGVRAVTDALVKQWVSGYGPRLHIVDFRPIIAEMQQKVGGQYWQLLLKRLMVRAGHMLAEQEGHVAMVTGEAIGQVSSQTLWNLAAISTPIPTPVLRPLVGFNKEDIIQKARDIGTYDASAGVPEFCALGGGKPITRGDSSRLSREEEKIEQSLLEMLLKHRVILMREEIEVRDEVRVEISEIPDDANVFDIRPKSAFRDWAYPNAIHLEFTTALDNVALLPKNRTYVFYCDVGLKSAFLAETMHKLGFRAMSYKGGLQKLKKYARQHSESVVE